MPLSRERADPDERGDLLAVQASELRHLSQERATTVNKELSCLRRLFANQLAWKDIRDTFDTVVRAAGLWDDKKH